MYRVTVEQFEIKEKESEYRRGELEQFEGNRKDVFIQVVDDLDLKNLIKAVNEETI